MQLAAVAKTADGVYTVYVFVDQSAELRCGMGVVAADPMYKITEKLAELGYAGDDLTAG
jgi:hypothetical protein